MFFDVGKTMINHPFGNGLYHLFMMMTGGWFMIVFTTLTVSYEQGSKDAMKGFNYDPPSLLKICDLLCVAIGGLM